MHNAENEPSGPDDFPPLSTPPAKGQQGDDDEAHY